MSPTTSGCSVVDCSRKHYARTWCRAHYGRWIRSGQSPMTPLKEMYPPGRFWSNVLFTEDCWLWKGPKWDGYGIFSKHHVRVHRYAYEFCVGPIPDGLTIDHLCRIRACVRPEHLEPVTHVENIKRGWAVRPRQSHCKNGHEFTPENTYRYSISLGMRVCKICDHIVRAQRREGVQECTLA